MIPKIKKILYATDLSKNSEYAFYYAVDMAKRHDAEIVFLHAIEPIPCKCLWKPHGQSWNMTSRRHPWR